jgi:hypothetical protein
MNQSDIRAMKQRLADRHDAENVEACLDVNRCGGIFWAIFCLLLIFIPL